MGPFYELDEETQQLQWQDESTGWQLMQRELTEAEHRLLDETVTRFEAEWESMLKTMAHTPQEKADAAE